MIKKRSRKGKDAVYSVSTFLPGAETHSISRRLKVRKGVRAAVLGPLLSDQLHSLARGAPRLSACCLTSDTHPCSFCLKGLCGSQFCSTLRTGCPGFAVPLPALLSPPDLHHSGQGEESCHECVAGPPQAWSPRSHCWRHDLEAGGAGLAPRGAWPEGEAGLAGRNPEEEAGRSKWGRD